MQARLLDTLDPFFSETAMHPIDPNRRRFLSQVGRGMLAAGLGGAMARDFGFAAESAADARIRFDGHDRLVDLLQSTAVDKFLPVVVEQIRQGTSLKDLVAAASLANARAFGGEDYVGFHTFMAFTPALRMAEQLPSTHQALPVLKVLYRQAARLEEADQHDDDTLRPIETRQTADHLSDALRDAVHQQDRTRGDALLGGAIAQSPEEGWNGLLPAVHEAPEVHRVVLAHRAWDMLDLVGREHAETMLRQSLHYCINVESGRQRNNISTADLIANVFDRCRLTGQTLGSRSVEDAWIAEFSESLLKIGPEEAAMATGEAIAAGIDPRAISEAVAITANQLVLRDPGRPKEWAQPNKPVGSVHGDSIGVHASDTAHAWRQIVAVSNPHNAMASLILSAWGVARDARNRPFADWQPRPLAEVSETVKTSDPTQLVQELDAAIRAKEQDLACALTGKYLAAGHSPQAVFDTLLRYACSEDGALHAEKYYWTVRDEYSRLRPRFRDGELIALARVTASEYGIPAPGVAEAKELLGVPPTA